MDNRNLTQPAAEGEEDEAMDTIQRRSDRWSIISSVRRLFEQPSSLSSDVRLSVSSTSPSRLPSSSAPSLRLIRLLSRNTSTTITTTTNQPPPSPRALEPHHNDTIPLPTTTNINFNTLSTTTTIPTTTAPLHDDNTNTLASEAERHRLTTTTTTSINLRSLLDSIYTALPFLALLLLIFTLQHLTHTIFIIWGTHILKLSNICFSNILAGSSTHNNVTVSLYHLATLPSVRKVLLYAMCLPLYLYFSPIGGLLLKSVSFRYPITIVDTGASGDAQSLSFADTVFAVVAADVFFRLLVILVNLIALKLTWYKHHTKSSSSPSSPNSNTQTLPSSSPSSSSSSSTYSSSSSKLLLRERVAMMNLISSTEGMYRCLLPIPTWWRYLSVGAGLTSPLGYSAGLFYLALKTLHSYKCVATVRIDIMQLRNPPLNELEKLGEQEVQQLLSQHRQQYYEHDHGRGGGDTTTTTTTITAAAANTATTMCPICHDTLSSPVKIASCSHVFCSECIDEWLERESTCPLCRGPVNHPGKIRFQPANLLPVMY